MTRDRRELPRATDRCVVIATVVMIAATLSARGGAEWTVIERPEQILAVAEVAKGGAFGGCLLMIEGAPRARTRRLSSVCERAGGAAAHRDLGPLPDGASALAIARGDRGMCLWIGVAGGVDMIEVSADGSLGPPAPVLRDERVSPVALDDRPDLDGDSRTDLLQATWDGLSAWRQEPSGRLVKLSDVFLAPQASIFQGQIAVVGESFMAIDDDAQARWSRPRAAPGRRLRVTRVPLGPAGAGEPCSAWIQTDIGLAMFDTRVARGDRLVGLAVRADRAELLGEYRLVVARLECDDTARGKRPELLVETPFPLWFRPRLRLEDADGDGWDDIVLIGTTGRLRPKVAVVVYRGRPAGSFAEEPIVWSRRVRGLRAGHEDWRWDLDGDTAADLSWLTESGLAYAHASPARSGALALETRRAAERAWPAPWRVEKLAGSLPASSSRGPLPVFEATAPPPDGETGPRRALLIPRVPLIEQE